jgi:hypothetical protein
MIASPNPGYFVYDGDDSAHRGAGPGPPGSAAVERTFNDYLSAHGVRTEPADFDGRSDYGPFIRARIPAGGLFSGAEETKSKEQANRWGGAAGQPFDPCYHRACDDLRNVDQVAFDRHLDALAWTVGSYAGAVGDSPRHTGGSTLPAAWALAAPAVGRASSWADLRPGRFPPMPADPELRRKLAKEGRLWALALVCAVVGAGTVARTGSVASGVVAFLITVGVLAPLLYVYERRRRV